MGKRQYETFEETEVNDKDMTEENFEKNLKCFGKRVTKKLGIE